MKKKSNIPAGSPNSKYEKIKSITLSALFSDDDLMEMLVLKGGNALNLIYNLAERASIDLDFSIQNKIKAHDFPYIENKIKKTLFSNFRENNYQVIDFKFFERPKNPNEGHPEFWGGYRIEFKVADFSVFIKYKDQPEYLSKMAENIGVGQLKTFSVDISKYEYCESKVAKKFEGLTIYVYSPQMIAIEKLRAICQQMPEYMISVKGNDKGASERARDFYDIYTITEKLSIDLTTSENIRLLKNIFNVKKVPIYLLKEIYKFRDFHARGYDSLKHTVPHTARIETFDFYFDYVSGLAESIISHGDNKSSI